MKLPNALKKVIDGLSVLPSIGPRQATRLAFYLVNRGANVIATLSRDFAELSRIKICERCFFPTSESGPRPREGVGVISEHQKVLCDICGNKNRDHGIIMVVEKETDLLSLENTGKFTGRYLIVGPIPKTGILEEWQKLRLQSLKSFIEKELGGPSTNSGHSQAHSTDSGQATEIILALNPTSAGDFHASLLAKELAPCAKKISRLGRGLPTGGEIEFADDETLGSALERRS